jgi:hypothetical protein
MYEAAALGANMTVPYGAWMGSVEEDSFWPPHDLCTEIQSFLATNEGLFSRKSAARVAVVFSTESNFVLETRDRALANNTLNLKADVVLPFWAVCESLCDALQPFDVVFFPDGTLRADTVTSQDLQAYDTVVLPYCHKMTGAQANTLLGYLDNGGRVVRLGPVGGNLPGGRGRQIEAHPGTVEAAGAQVADLLEARQVRASKEIDGAVHLQRTPAGVALHLIRYDYDADSDSVLPLDELELGIELDRGYGSARAFAPGEVPRVELNTTGGLHTLKLHDVPIYSIVELREGEGG